MSFSGEDTMSFSKLSKEKKSHLLLVAIITFAALASIGFGLVRYQKDQLAKLDERKEKLKAELSRMNDTIRRKGEIKKSMDVVIEKLDERELGMARGDLYAWFIDVIGRYKSGYKLEIPQTSPATPAARCTLIPKFPYNQSSVTIAGTGHYHDIGRFVADFENHYPFVRLLNLNIEPSSTASGADREKLSFRADIVALVKPK
jgi:Tfp pilus assembly protein PilO